MMIVSRRDSGLEVIFFKTHLGHGQDLVHLDLNDEQRAEIAGFLSLGVDRKAILERIRSSWSQEHFERIHLTNQKDLTNIEKFFNLNSQVIRDGNDLVSVESLIGELHSGDSDPILHYTDPYDETFGFVLVISTEGQRGMLEHYSSNVVAIDSTHGTNDYDFQLTTLMIIDENR